MIYISLGTNQGDRTANLELAVANLPPAVIPLRLSQIYETPPWGYLDQPLFLNQVVEAKTDLEPRQLLTYLKDIELRLGRKATFRYGPRLIDLDILFYDDLTWESSDLTIPHPHLAQRAFVLVPMAELAPDMRHPIFGKTVSEMLAEIDSHDIARYSPGKS